MNLLILADDLTGAADSAARCHHAGLPAHVYLRPLAGPLPPGAIAFSTDSRYLAPSAAAEQVRQLLIALPTAPTAQWYKKIDSTFGRWLSGLCAGADTSLAFAHFVSHPNRATACCVGLGGCARWCGCAR